MAGVFHRVEVIEIAEELIEAVRRRQELIEVAQVVLAELAEPTSSPGSCRSRRHLRLWRSLNSVIESKYTALSEIKRSLIAATHPRLSLG
jgi:hypothetical protein